MRTARNAKKAKRVKNPPKSKLRKSITTRITKARFLRAIEGTGGIRKRIAERLRCHPSRIYNLLVKPDWDDMRLALVDEEERISDLAEELIEYAIMDRTDVPTAVRASMWHLSRRRREKYGDESKMVIEGGKNPIKTQSTTIAITVDTLDLPVEVRATILEAMEKKEREEENLLPLA